jgi:catechol 2,3-dioxygenase
MAISGVLRPGYVQIRVLDLDAALKHYVDRVGLDLVSKGPDGRAYLRAWDEFDRHSVILREADHAGMDVMGFKVATDVELTRYGKRLKEAGVKVEEVAAGEQPGVGRRLSFVIPTGHRIELFAQMDISPQCPPTENPDVWSQEPRGMRVVRFDHCLLYGPNIPETSKLFTDVLDFRLTEKVMTPDNKAMIGAFLSCATKAHDVAFIHSDEPARFHHASFFLESWHDVGHAADLISRYNISHDIGPTRHGITRGQTIYFFDPSGNRNEVFAGGYLYYPDHPTRVWSADELGKAIFYYERQLNERFLSVTT